MPTTDNEDGEEVEDGRADFDTEGAEGNTLSWVTTVRVDLTCGRSHWIES